MSNRGRSQSGSRSHGTRPRLGPAACSRRRTGWVAQLKGLHLLLLRHHRTGLCPHDRLGHRPDRLPGVQLRAPCRPGDRAVPDLVGGDRPAAARPEEMGALHRMTLQNNLTVHAVEATAHEHPSEPPPNERRLRPSRVLLPQLDRDPLRPMTDEPAAPQTAPPRPPPPICDACPAGRRDRDAASGGGGESSANAADAD